MEGRSAIQQHFIDGEITDALARNRLPHHGPLREVLDAHAEVVGPVGEPYVRLRDNRGQLIWIDSFIEELRLDPKFGAFFPDPPRIARTDEERIPPKLRVNRRRHGRGCQVANRMLASSEHRRPSARISV